MEKTNNLFGWTFYKDHKQEIVSFSNFFSKAIEENKQKELSSCIEGVRIQENFEHITDETFSEDAPHIISIFSTESYFETYPFHMLEMIMKYFMWAMDNRIDNAPYMEYFQNNKKLFFKNLSQCLFSFFMNNIKLTKSMSEDFIFLDYYCDQCQGSFGYLTSNKLPPKSNFEDYHNKILDSLKDFVLDRKINESYPMLLFYFWICFLGVTFIETCMGYGKS